MLLIHEAQQDITITLRTIPASHNKGKTFAKKTVFDLHSAFGNHDELTPGARISQVTSRVMSRNPTLRVYPNCAAIHHVD